MKLCTRVRVEAVGPDGTIEGLRILDISGVGDDHSFGLRPDTMELHIEGTAAP